MGKRKAAQSQYNTQRGTTPVRKRARIGKGKHILPPSESDLKGHLTFTKKKDKARYQDIYVALGLTLFGGDGFNWKKRGYLLFLSTRTRSDTTTTQAP
ncbi:hypothetical protein Patl1_21494 [Pistacia atlantica]|uniref:Uncharacterized protein n=1 Tax=Pistacia atlantica TaxID=434234 RepID=A0ACC1BMW4_9ROSI|nr:hypothetical protein Patl1_21494 [Pistacia atlantica]